MKGKFLTFFLILCSVLVSHFVFAEEEIKEVLVSGIRSEKDQFLFDPKPRTSEYLKTYQGGFYVSKYGARYYCLWDIVKERHKSLYVRMELENPLNEKEPIIQEGVIELEAHSLNVAYGPIEGLKMYGNYRIKVYLYDDEAKENLVDQLTQEIKSYVDTRDKKMVVDGGIVTSTGEKIADVINKND
jgi:hypothetical protein